MEWSCRCGEVGFDVSIDAKSDSRIVCYCNSCRAFAEKTGAAGTLDPSGGVDLFQTAVERLAISRGADRLAWTRITARGPLRWFATCCGAPVANTLPTRQIPFATMMSDGFCEPDALPPILGRVNKRDATAHIEGDMGHPGKAIPAFFKRALKSRLTGAYKRNPFFTAQGRPIADGPTEPNGTA